MNEIHFINDIKEAAQDKKQVTILTIKPQTYK